MSFFKLDYALEENDAGQRDAAQCAVYASPAVRPKSGTLRRKLHRLAAELVAIYLTHQSWKAHDGVFVHDTTEPLMLAVMEQPLNACEHKAASREAKVREDLMPIPFKLEHAIEQVSARHFQSQRRSLRKLTGVKLSEAEAHAVWPRVLEHKWFLSERLGRDVGLRVAAVDYFENIQPPTFISTRKRWEQLPRLPMMLPFGERP